MTKIGETATSPFVILNTNGTCETSPSTLSSEVRRFMSSYGDNSDVVFFYESEQKCLIPCGIGPSALYQRPEGACVGIVPEKAVVSLLGF